MLLSPAQLSVANCGCR